jgi:ketopantoate reductase
MPPVDLVILFVKSMHTREALQTNAGLIGPSTWSPRSRTAQATMK